MLKESPQEDMRKLSQVAQTIMGRITTASRNLKLYPASHPILQRLISDSFGKLKEALGENDYFSFALAGNVLLINDKPAKIANKLIVERFLTTLGKRKIGKITFIKGVDMDEFISLIEILSFEPEDIEKKGGLKKVVSNRNLQHITVGGISYGKIDDRKDTGIEWKDLLSLISNSDDFIRKIGSNPSEFSQLMVDTLKDEKGSPGWGGRIKEAVGNITERLFNKYGKTDINTYTETVSKLILVLGPEMQSELLFSKPEIPYWEEVVNNVVDNITSEELGDLIAKETKKMSETIVITGEEGQSGESRITNIDSFLTNFVDKSKRKEELIPALRNSFKKAGVNPSILDYMSGGKTKKELVNIIEEDLMKTNIDTETLVSLKTLIQKNVDIEELLKSLIESLNSKKSATRAHIVKSLVEATDKLLVFGRIDLLKLIIIAFSNRLGKETEQVIFKAIVKALSMMAIKLRKEGKRTITEAIDDILNNYLTTLEESEKLHIVVEALSSIGDEKALKHLIYAIDRDVAFGIIQTELVKKGAEVFPLLLHSMKTIEDKMTRVRIISLLIDTAKIVPDYEIFLKKYVDDSKWFVRRNIAIILGEIGGEKSFGLLSNLLKDKEPKVRTEVMTSLSKIKSEESEIHLLEGLNDQNNEVVKRALTSLREVGTEMSVFALKDLLEKQSFLKKEAVIEIQQRVISILCSIGGNDTIDILRKVIFNRNLLGRYRYDDKIRLLAVDGLNKIDTVSSRRILSRVAKLKDQKVGKKAEEILKKQTFQ